MILQARNALSLAKEGEALRLIEDIKEGDPRWHDSLFILGRIQAGHGRPENALRYFNRIPDDGSPLSLETARIRSELYLTMCDLKQAVAQMEYVNKASGGDAVALRRIGFIFSNAGLVETTRPYLFEDLKAGTISIADLVALTDPDRPRPAMPWVRCNDSPDPYLQIGFARKEIERQQSAEARARLERIVAADPGVAEAQMLLGELYLAAGDAEFLNWSQRLPESVLQHAGIWHVRGLWARSHDQQEVAARCFWEAVRLDPSHRRATYQLFLVLASNHPEASAAFAERAGLLKECSEQMEKLLLAEGLDQTSFKEIVRILGELGRDWEALAWARMARDRFGLGSWADELFVSIQQTTADNPPRFRPQADLTVRHDLSSLPGFETIAGLAAVGQPQVKRVEPQVISFVDVAEQAGLDFTYFQSPDPKSHEVRIFESTGGGVGAADYDLDGEVDLILTQGEPWPLKENQPAPSPDYEDALYRRVGGRFLDASIAAGIQPESGYGQGCSWGDFNNDGFSDLYVANIGQNQLLLNNGDGTFTDATAAAGAAEQSWTTSCLILDLNNDGHPDLYDVNYLQGEEVFTVECGRNRCSVRGYQGAPDRVWLSRGDGTFREILNATPRELAKGLGIVALHETPQSRPDLFIANDQVPNFYLHPLEQDGMYEDRAVRHGLALNMNGESTAAMGVAAGDINGDSLTDLFVTNFEFEANCMYVQHEGGYFEDAVIGAGLREPGVDYVGWGTQFLDAENDGDLDLVVANGHVANFGQTGVQYEMPLQFFLQRTPDRFEMHSFADGNGLFNRRLLGRALARLDWNRDGRQDFVLSNIAAPAILAENRTAGSGSWLSVALRASGTSRDALGSRVTVESSGTTSVLQLLSGDGYQCTNQRLLHFGLGDKAEPVRVVIEWPSGTRTVLEGVPLNVELSCVEGMSTATLRDGNSHRSIPAQH